MPIPDTEILAIEHVVRILEDMKRDIAERSAKAGQEIVQATAHIPEARHRIVAYASDRVNDGVRLETLDYALRQVGTRLN